MKVSIMPGLGEREGERGSAAAGGTFCPRVRTDCELFLCVCSLHNIMGVKLDLSLDQNDFAPFPGWLNWRGHCRGRG